MRWVLLVFTQAKFHLQSSQRIPRHGFSRAQTDDTLLNNILHYNCVTRIEMRGLTDRACGCIALGADISQS